MKDIKDITTIEFCLVNLSNTGQFEFYEAEEMEDVNIAYNSFRCKYNADEIEIQALNQSQLVTDNIYSIFELLEKYSHMDLYEVIPILDATGCIIETEKVIENGNFMLIRNWNKLDAFETYIEEIGFLEEVPERFRNYIDLERVMRDFEFEGLTIHRVSDEQFIFIY